MEENSDILIGKKRKGNKDLWKRNILKKARVKGEEFVDSRRNIVPKKATGAACSCKRKSCFEIVTEEEEEVLRSFCDLGSKNEQDLHLQHLIDVYEVKQRRPRKGEEARTNSNSFKYHVLVGSQRLEVCFKAFLSLHSITIKRVKRLRALKCLVKSPIDQRGKHVKKAHSVDTRQLLRQHINSFPYKQTKYASKPYRHLDARLNKKLLCSLYNEKYPDNKVSESYFSTFFEENFNLHFGRPQSDCCYTCEGLKNKLKSPHLNETAKRAAAAELVVHKRKASKFYNRLDKEVKEKGEPHVLSICFDFMQNIQLPRIPVQETFYLRQLTNTVFCIHDIKKNNAVIYMYHEGTAKKGPNEVCSLVYDYLKSVPSHYTELRVFSDNCGGQNKNHALTRFLMALIDMKKFEKIEQFFPVRGHSFLPCDRNFGIIKRALKRHDRIYSLHEVTSILIHSSRNQKFIVKEVNTNEILDFKTWWPRFYKRMVISEETKPRTVPKDKKVNFLISTFMHFTYNSKFPYHVVARHFIDSMVEHTFCLKQPGILEVNLPTKIAYPLDKVPIKDEKIKDITKLLPYIPDEYLQFYNEILEWNRNIEEVHAQHNSSEEDD